MIILIKFTINIYRKLHILLDICHKDELPYITFRFANQLGHKYYDSVEVEYGRETSWDSRSGDGIISLA